MAPNLTNFDTYITTIIIILYYARRQHKHTAVPHKIIKY